MAILELLLGPANAALSGHALLGILDPADELVASHRRNVVPSIERGRIGDQRLAEIFGKLVYHPAGQLGAHRGRVPGPLARSFGAFVAAGATNFAKLSAGARLGPRLRTGTGMETEVAARLVNGRASG